MTQPFVYGFQILADVGKEIVPLILCKWVGSGPQLKT